MTKPKLPPGTRFLSHDDLRARGIDYTKVTLTKLVEEKKFPQPVVLSQRKVVWVERDINDWMMEKISQK